LGVVEELHRLGWTESEARAYVVLAAAESPLTGYEVAKRARLTRPNVYAALERLVERGAAMLSASDGHYEAVPFSAVAAGFLSSATARMQRIAEGLPASGTLSSTVVGEGDEALYIQMRRMLANARTAVDAYVSRLFLETLRDDWRAVRERGVTLRLICLSGCRTPCRDCPDTVRPWPEAVEQDWLMVVRDGEETLLATSCSGRPALLLTSRSPLPRISDMLCHLLTFPSPGPSEGSLLG
jgi:hypothetical protein